MCYVDGLFFTTHPLARLTSATANHLSKSIDLKDDGTMYTSNFGENSDAVPVHA